MEFVGKSVKKKFKGFGVFNGIVQSHDTSSGFFKIKYEDGDSEDLDFSEVASLLEDEKVAVAAPVVDPKPRLGRKPKKRRRVEPDKEAENRESGNSGAVDKANGFLDINGNVDLNDEFVGDSRTSGCITVDLNETLDKTSGGFDLNAGFNFHLNEEQEEVNNSNLSVDFQGDSENKKKRECIDLNLDVSVDLDENSKEVDLEGKIEDTQRRECLFDLNLGIDEEIKDDLDGDFGGKVVESKNLDTLKMESNGKLEEVFVANDLSVELAERNQKGDVVSGENFRGCDSVGVMDVKVDFCEGIDLTSAYKVESGGRRRGRRRKNLPGNLNSALETTFFQDANAAREDCTIRIDENRGDNGSSFKEGIASRRRGRTRKLADNLNPTPETTDANTVKEDCTMGIDGNQVNIGSPYEVESVRRRRGRRRKLAGNLNSTLETIIFSDANSVREDCTVGIEGIQDDIGSSYKEVNTGSRKRRKILDNGNSMQETTLLRRSTRRGSAKSSKFTTTSATCVVNDISLSPAASALTEDKPVKSHHEWPVEPVILPPKVELPPSSRNLDLHGIPILNLFSVYACLRSFSTLLFLSPFGLEEFVAALRCNSPSSLFDSIHVSILQTLRTHLEHLSDEGSESATNCLRSLNWGLLDLVTWPVFMVEYLLIHGSGLKPGFNLSDLNLFKSNYHKQPVSVKLEILQCLCDDMIEVEAIRSELIRRSSGAESDLDFDRNMNLGAYKKRRVAMDVSGNSCLTEEAADDTTDWNSDECCLCKMDGSLICCDGCPAAYHAKCVGATNDSLPEGDWYCPECAISRDKPWMKPRKSLRGAELLGVDAYGRLYFSSCGYLLVSDSCDTEFSFNYYQRDDLSVVIQVLKSSEMYYNSILEAIHKHWDIPVSSYGACSNLSSLNHTIGFRMCIPPVDLASSETHATKNEAAVERKPEEKLVNTCSGQHDVEVSKTISPTCMSSEGSAETTQIASGNHNFQKEGLDCSNRSAGLSDEFEVPGKSPLSGSNSLASHSSDINQEKNIISSTTGHASSVANATSVVTLQVQHGSGYLNYYGFGQIAASIGELLMSKSSDKTTESTLKSNEEMVSAQMKVILKRSSKFCWTSIPSLSTDVQKEKCGWCFSCRADTDDSDCLFNMSLGPVQEGSATEVVGLQSKRNRKGYLIDIICHILLIEDRLQGLLLGPWLNPHYSSLWRKSILKAFDITSVKFLLLILEANVRRLALSADWLKHVDAAVTMGSASHFVAASSRASSKNGIGRKRARSTEFESNPSSNSSSGLSMFWRRGGRLSRRLFSWKVLPSSLISKAARQGGCRKIPGILYPENSDFAKRSKYVAWQATVESSTTAEQLALQVRELDLNIRWDEIENTHPFSVLDKESRKSFRLFKKVIVRRKCIEAEGPKFLLDFGKRRSIPEVVQKNGSMIKESSSERKKYWLNESYVPLHLLKSFEEKRIARRAAKVSSGKLSEACAVVKKPSKKNGFSYLFARAERSEYHQCGHCKKDVLIREAVCCQHCKGFFHKRHVKKSPGSLTAECIYACHRCHNGKYAKVNAKTGKRNVKKGKTKIKSTKVHLQKSKKATIIRNSVRLKNSKKAAKGSRQPQSQNNKVTVLPLRRSPRKAKQKALQNKVGGRKRGRPAKSKKGANKKPKRENSLRKRRTDTHHSYWLNGLLFSRKPDDERVTQFRRKRFFAVSESVILDQPKCHLCLEAGYASASNYISCEICEEWFHGDAFGLDSEKINKLIGFRCHMCRKKTPPICPHVPATRTHESQMADVQYDAGTEFSKQGPDATKHLIEDHEGSLPVDESGHGEGQLGTSLNSNLKSVSESKLDAENGHAFGNVKEDTDAIGTSNENLKPDFLTSSNVNHMVEENTIKSGDDATVTSNDGTQLSYCKVDVDLIETELVSLGPESSTDGLTTATLKFPVDGALLDSVRMHPQPFMASTEL